MGGQNSKLEKSLGEDFPEDERIFGLENYGNTCYANAVLQCLYFCKPFREQVSSYRPVWLTDGEREEDDDATLLSCLRDLFLQISTQKKKTGSIGPKNFIIKLKQENELFQG